MRIIFILFLFILSSFSLSLQKGWNLKGSSREININDLNKSCINIIWSYDKNWRYFSNKINLPFPRIKTLKQNSGFWILAKNDCNISLSIHNYEYQKMLKVGINANWAIFPRIIKIYDSSFPSYFAKEGFSTIRLRFDFTDKILSVFDYNETKYINYLKKVVDDCEANNLNVVLADGAEEFKNNPNEETLNRLVDTWILIAKNFKNYPKNLSYNLIIEPGKSLNQNNTILNKFYQKVYKEIRKIDKTRILLWAPDKRSNPKLLDETWYPENDEYILAEWHNYAAGPKEGYEEDIPKMIKTVKNWEEKRGIPTWFGAWMPGNYNHGDDYNITEQIKFATFLTKELKNAGIPFAINADTQFFDYENRKWNNRYPVVKAIIKTYYEN